MTPVLPGLAVTCYRVRQSPVIRARGAGINIEIPAAGSCLTGMWMPMPAPK